MYFSSKEKRVIIVVDISIFKIVYASASSCIYKERKRSLDIFDTLENIHECDTRYSEKKQSFRIILISSNEIQPTNNNEHYCKFRNRFVSPYIIRREHAHRLPIIVLYEKMRITRSLIFFSFFFLILKTNEEEESFL